MDNVNVKFVVLKIEEQKLNDQPYKVSVDVVGSFNTLEDARKCKEAKDTLDSKHQMNLTGVLLNLKFSRFFISPLSKVKPTKSQLNL